MGTPLHEDFQSTEDIPENSNDLRKNVLDQIEAEAEAEAIKLVKCTDLDEEEADNNQPLEKMENQVMSTKAEVIEELMEALLQDVVSHSAPLKNEELKSVAAEAEAEVIPELMNIYLDETEETVEKHLGKLMALIHVKTENEKLKMTAAKAEATDQLMNIYLDNTEDTMEKHLGCEVMSTADTEAEASRLNMQTDLDETGTPTDQPLGPTQMTNFRTTSFEPLDTEAEAFKQQLQIHGDKADIPTEQPLVRCDEISTADTEAEASRLNMQTHLDETGKPTDQSLAEIEALKDNFPVNEATTDQQGRNTRKGPCGKSGGITYKRHQEERESKADEEENSSRKSADRAIQVGAVGQWRHQQVYGKT
ncbi:hypothetical protein SRHO_G00147290 [Serrasalmus rhombeus]